MPKKILLIEDDAWVANMISRVLTPIDVDVVRLVTNSVTDDVVRNVIMNHHPLGIIQNWGDGNRGRRIARIAMAEYLPVIVISGMHDAELMISSILAKDGIRVTKIIQKPFPPALIQELVKGWDAVKRGSPPAEQQE